ncbi:hypothetical protein B0O99DRAFT_527176, partial [Bisporella sp. PMI_857]
SWVVEHHKKNLILELERPKKASSILDNIKIPRKVKLGDAEKTSIKTGSNSQEDRRFRINLAELQRMYMRKLQSKLIKHTVDMRYTLKETEDWEETLRQYIKASKDYDYMTACSTRERDPFLASGEYWIDHAVLLDAIASVGQDFISFPFETIRSTDSWRDKKDNSGISEARNQGNRKLASKSFRKRLWIAVLGGAFLLGPMWLMVLHHTLYTALVSTTVAVALFGLLMAWRLERDTDVLASTAAYAAVLVVFVGLDTQGS